jgi:hypothetical protein
MDGPELELVCPCGFENFERIVVQRKPNAPIVTDFVACVGCKAMYWSLYDGLTLSPRTQGTR